MVVLVVIDRELGTEALKQTGDATGSVGVLILGILTSLNVKRESEDDEALISATRMGYLVTKALAQWLVLDEPAWVTVVIVKAA